MLSKLAQEERTIILYESPMRLVKTLGDLLQHFGAQRKCSVSRELTKMFEETIRGTIAEVLEHFASKQVKGEIVIVIQGSE